MIRKTIKGEMGPGEQVNRCARGGEGVLMAMASVSSAVVKEFCES